MIRVNGRKGFTLVELLAVVAIITLLLTMITPAIEQARTQAKIAVCAAQLRTVASAGMLYAKDNQRFYPQRHDNYMWDALHIRAVYPGLEFDLRPQFQPYMPLKAFLDPLLGGFELDDSNVSPDSNLLSSFNVYTDLRRGPDDDLNNQSFDKMERLGDRFESTDSKSPGGPVTYRFSVFAADRDMYNRLSATWTASSHPDKASPPRLRVRHYRDITLSKLTYSEWVISGHPVRPVDLNYAYTDGSVRRFNDVTKDDERMAKIVATNFGEYLTGSATDGRFEHLPKE